MIKNVNVLHTFVFFNFLLLLSELEKSHLLMKRMKKNNKNIWAKICFRFDGLITGGEDYNQDFYNILWILCYCSSFRNWFVHLFFTLRNYFHMTSKSIESKKHMEGVDQKLKFATISLSFLVIYAKVYIALCF